MHTSNYSYIKIFNCIIIGASFIFLVPLFVFAHPEDADLVPHDDGGEVAVVQVIQIEEEVSAIGEVEEEDDDDHFVGDAHTDHAHEPTISGPWWQSQTWWLYLIVSLFLMSILSFLVYKYLENK